jgi:hypothetical protein
VRANPEQSVTRVELPRWKLEQLMAAGKRGRYLAGPRYKDARGREYYRLPDGSVRRVR